MSLNHLTSITDDASKSLNIGCEKIKSKELILENEDKTITTFKFLNQGIAGYTIHSNGAGETYWAPDDTSAGGMVYAGVEPVTLGTHYKISSTDGNACVDSKLQETATELNIQNLKIINASNPTNPQDLATKFYVDSNANPFDQSLNTTDSVTFTNELVVQNGINSDNFYFKDEETKCIIQHKVSGIKYNILEGLNDGTISIGDANISNKILNLHFDNTYCGSLKLFPGYNPISRSLGEATQPFGQVYSNELDLRTVGIVNPKIKINGNIGQNNQVLVTNGTDSINWSNQPYDMIFACSDETSVLTTGTKTTVVVPRSFTLESVRATLTDAQTSGSVLQVDITKNGTTIFSTKLTIDNTEKTSDTSSVPYSLSTFSFSNTDEIKIIIDQVGTGGKGLKVYLIGKL